MKAAHGFLFLPSSLVLTGFFFAWAAAEGSPRMDKPVKVRAAAKAMDSRARIQNAILSPDESQSSVLAGEFTCDAHCFTCNLGNCPPSNLGDGLCDCACQFADNQDCGSNCSCPSVCRYCWCNTSAENACPTSWYNDGFCDCACQFSDIDCAPTGACCAANNTCSVRTQASCISSNGAYAGNNVSCVQANCAARCPAGCQLCWEGTPRDGNCDPTWNGNGVCDCGCQFTDTDCTGPTPTGACCSPENICSVRSALSCLDDVEGAYQGNGTTCAGLNCAARCLAGCQYCYIDTPLEGQCDPRWEGDTVCDCGCQFVDPDCGPTGACCSPINGLCVETTEETCIGHIFGVFHEVGTDCSEVNCDRCDAGCDWCWKDTLGEHACLAEWAKDADCDCNCQFTDPVCPPGVCGNLICEENATQCADDCQDLRSFAEFQNCFDPGVAEPPQCYGYVYILPLGVGLEDYAIFEGFISGP